MHPTVSIVIPTYNRPNFLGRAIESCFDGNDNLEIEVVVVDDGSAEESKRVLRRISNEREQVRPIFQANQGAPTARNRGLREANGRFVKFLDDDDCLAEGALEEEVRMLENSGASVSCGNLRIRGSSGKSTIETEPVPDLASGIFRGTVVTYPHVFLYRHEAIEDVDWNSTLRYHQDTDFAVRVASTGASAVSPDRVVGTWNDHDGDRITSRVKQATDHSEIIRQRISTIEMGIDRLRRHGALQEYHLKAAATGIWTWAHMCSAYDLQCFRECVDFIRMLDPSFTPSRSSALLSTLDNMWGPEMTEKVLFPVRWAKMHLPV